MQQQNNNASQDDRIWVSNQQAVVCYLFSPDGFARLWGSSCSRFYEKRADATGRPLPMEIYEYTKVSPQISNFGKEASNLSIEDINARFDAITERIDALEKAKKGAVKNGTKSNADDTGI